MSLSISAHTHIQPPIGIRPREAILPVINGNLFTQAEFNSLPLNDRNIWNFYNNNLPIPEGDCRGMTLDQLLQTDPDTRGGRDFLEERHGFIQWLFPTNEPSQIVPGSPYYRHTQPLKAGMRMQSQMALSLRMMKKFYTHTPPEGHNQLRVTRMIKSLRLHDLDREAQGFCRWVIERTPNVDQNTKNIWLRAARLPVVPEGQLSAQVHSTATTLQPTTPPALPEVTVITPQPSTASPVPPSDESCCGRIIQKICDLFAWFLSWFSCCRSA